MVLPRPTSSAALKLMAAQGQAKGKFRTLYHSVIAPSQGEFLNAAQMKYAADTLAKNLGMEGHQRIIVEHRKDGRQHFHVVFNILHPITGKQARLQWTKKKEWDTSRQLERELGLKPVAPRGKASQQWEHQRGKRSGIDPVKVRKEVTRRPSTDVMLLGDIIGRLTALTAETNKLGSNLNQIAKRLNQGSQQRSLR